MSDVRVCPCVVSSISNLIINTISYQRSANTVYNAKSGILASSIAGTLVSPNGNPIFKSDYERMQYLAGKIGAAGGCGVPPKTFAIRL